MTIPGSANPLLLATAAGAAAGYEIPRSVRFNSADSAYLERTNASAGNLQVFTLAFWVKRTTLGGPYSIFGSSLDFGQGNIRFESDDTLGLLWPNNYVYKTTAVFRDVSAWYHCVVAIDTTASSGSRVKFYVNGVEFTNRTGSEPTLNLNFTGIQNSGAVVRIGRRSSGNYLNGYLADIHFIDGQALDPTSFGEFDDNGVWQPIEYTGSYGTNGFHLPFSDNSTAAALGTDTSGNNNTWTVNNISVTAGSGNDSLVDTPTSYGTGNSGGDVRGNYCTWNPLNQSGSNTLSNGNLDVVVATGVANVVPGSFGVTSGKWYWEVTPTAMSATAGMIGIADLGVTPSARAYTGAGGWYYFAFDGTKYNNNSGASYGASYAVNDVIGVALDMDAGTLTFYKNGVSQGVAYSSGLIGKVIAPSLNNGTAGSGTQTYVANFGQRPFAYTAPSGFKALCTTNLPDPLVAKPSEVMDVKLYTGNGSTQTISGLGFSPDFVWIKERNAAADHALYDIVRGTQARLESNTTDVEATSDSGLTAFNSDGFALSTLAQVNTNNDTYVAWTWDAGSSTVTNTQGSITSQVRANPSAGFSVITYTGNGVSGATIGHGLGVAPEFFIVKCRNTTATSWLVYVKPLSATSFLLLDSTAAVGSNATAWNNTAPSSTTITLGNSAFSNGNTQTYVCYAFSPVAGYSSFGSYTGNGSADGSFVYTGFRPAFVLMKRSDSASNWWILDNKRSAAHNDVDGFLYPNGNAGEAVATALDLVSNGFKMRRTNPTDVNASGGTYIYAAFAENPFKYARAR